MKTTTKPAPKASDTPYSEVAKLALDSIEHSLERLIEVRCNDEHWSDDDVDIDFSAELALFYVKHLKQAIPEKGDLFYGLCMAIGPIRVAMKQFSRPDCTYARVLQSTERLIDTMSELIDFAPVEAA